MGIKTIVTKTAGKAADAVAKLSTLSPEQLQEIQDNREAYLSEKPEPDDVEAVELTKKLLAVCGVEIFNAYLPQIVELYTPVSSTAEYGGRQFDTNQKIPLEQLLSISQQKYISNTRLEWSGLKVD